MISHAASRVPESVSASPRSQGTRLKAAIGDFVGSRSLFGVGLGIFYAWAWALCQSPVFYQSASPLEMARGYWIITLLVGQFIWVPVLLNKTPGFSLARNKLVVVGLPIVTAIGTILIGTTRGSGTASWIQFIVGAALAGLGGAFFPVIWGESFGSMGGKRASVGVGLSGILGMAAYLGLLAIPIYALQLAFAALLPAASVFLLRLGGWTKSAVGATEAPRVAQERSPMRLAIIPAVYGLVYGVVVGMTNFLTTTGLANSGAVTVIGSAIGSALLLAGAIIFWRSLDVVGFTYQVIVPLLGAGLALLPFTGNPLVAAGLVLSGFLIFDLVMYALYSDISYRLGLSPVRLFALSRSVSHAGVLVGVLVGRFLTGDSGFSQRAPVTVSLVLLYVLIFALAFALNGASVTSGWGVVSSAEKAPPSKDGPAGGAAPVPEALHRLSLAHGLSKREEEVLVLLAQGRTLPYIEKALFISLGTAKFHARNIYAKLGVHNRQGLLDCVEAFQREGAR